MGMNKIIPIILFLSICYTNVTSNYFICNKNINDYHALGFNPSYINHSYDSSNFKIGLVAATQLSNNSISLDWLNNNLLAGVALENDQDKSELLSVFNDQEISLRTFAKMQLGFSYKDFSLLFSSQSFGDIFLPYSVIDLVFYGLDFDKNISLDAEKMQIQSVLPITFAHSRDLDQFLPEVNFPVRNIRLGLSTKVLLGLALFDSEFKNSVIDIEEGSIKMSGDMQTTYSLFGSSIDVDGNNNAEFKLGSDYGPSGMGYAFDLGISADYSDNFNFGLSLNNILGHVNWSESSTYQYKVSYDKEILSSEFETIGGMTTEQQDSLFKTMIIDQSNKIVRGLNTSYPSYLLINGSYSIKDFLFSSYALVPFNDVYYKSVQFSIGATYDKFREVPFHFQLKFDTDGQIKWFAGLDLDFKYYELKVGFSQQDGFLNSAKGIAFGISNSFKF